MSLRLSKAFIAIASMFCTTKTLQVILLATGVNSRQSTEIYNRAAVHSFTATATHTHTRVIRYPAGTPMSTTSYDSTPCGCGTSIIDGAVIKPCWCGGHLIIQIYSRAQILPITRVRHTNILAFKPIASTNKYNCSLAHTTTKNAGVFQAASNDMDVTN